MKKWQVAAKNVGSPLIPDIDTFAEMIVNLNAAPGVWFLLKKLLEMDVFDAIMRNRSFTLFSVQKA